MLRELPRAEELVRVRSDLVTSNYSLWPHVARRVKKSTLISQARQLAAAQDLIQSAQSQLEDVIAGCEQCELVGNVLREGTRLRYI